MPILLVYLCFNLTYKLMHLLSSHTPILLVHPIFSILFSILDLAFPHSQPLLDLLKLIPCPICLNTLVFTQAQHHLLFLNKHLSFMLLLLLQAPPLHSLVNCGILIVGQQITSRTIFRTSPILNLLK